MFGRKKNAQPNIVFDPESQRAVLRCSICTGEQVAGFRDKVTGKFTEVSLIRNEDELDAFMERYHLDGITKEY